MIVHAVYACSFIPFSSILPRAIARGYEGDIPYYISLVQHTCQTTLLRTTSIKAAFAGRTHNRLDRSPWPYDWLYTTQGLPKASTHDAFWS
jgi:hypothetical protein